MFKSKPSVTIAEALECKREGCDQPGKLHTYRGFDYSHGGTWSERRRICDDHAADTAHRLNAAFDAVHVPGEEPTHLH